MREVYLDIRPADHVEIFVPMKAKVESQTVGDLPIVLAVETELFGGDVEVGISVGDTHASDSTRRCETVRVTRLVLLWSAGGRIQKNHAGVSVKVHFERRIKLEEATLDGVINEIHASLEGMVANSL